MNEFKPGHAGYRTRKKCQKGSYILAYTGHRKNAKRHIIERYKDLKTAIYYCETYRRNKPKWTVHVYNYCWEVIL